MKGLAIKVVSGILVVALVVVVALAISGVFGVNSNGNTIIANAAPSIENTQVLNDVSADKVFYITTTKSITDLSSFVIVKDPNGKNVKLAISDTKDKDGNIGFLPAEGHWTEGFAYKIQLISSSVAFAEENLKGLNELIFVVTAEDALDCELNDNVVELKADDFDVLVNSDDSWTLSINNADASTYTANTVFVYNAPIDANGKQTGKQYANSDETFKSVAYKIDANTTPVYNRDSNTFTATVKDADETDVYKVLNVHQKNIGITEDDFILDTDATLQSVYASDWFLSTVQYLYQEELGTKNFNVGDYGTFKLDYNFKKGENGKLASVTLDLTLEFKGFLKSAKNAKVTIKMQNVLDLSAKLNFQADPKAFDLAINADLATNLAVDGGFEYNFNNKDDNNNTDANTALKNIVANVAHIVSDAIGSENKTQKSFIFATWVIPVGTTPIQIVENMGIEVKSDLKAKLSASASNVVNCQFGVAYVDSNVTPYFNIGDKFDFHGLSLTGTWENQVGLCNEIGITACGIVSVNLDVSFGLYLDLAGRLEMSGWSIMNEELNIVPAYYVELGLYTKMSVNGKIWKINIKQTTFLDKRWPLWDIGYKYVPMDKNDVFADETVYLASSYFYFTKFDTMSYDIQNMDAEGSIHAIDWDEFNYEYDHSLLNMVDNKVRVSATAPAEFTTEIVVTSKVNKLVSKVVKVVKSPEMPTAEVLEKDYVKGSNDDLYYGVHLNTSKFIGISIDNTKLSEGSEYEFEESLLTIPAREVNKLSYGSHEILLESSKGYLRLKVNVTSDKNIVPEDGFGTYVFDKAVPSAVLVEMPLYGNAITNINLNDNEWSYSKHTETLRVNANALIDEEDLQVTVNYSNGEVGVFHITTVDNRAVVLKTNVYDYNLNSGSALPLDVELYNNAIDKVYFGTKNVTNYLNGSSISAEAFESVPQGQVNARFEVNGKIYNFVVRVGANNMLIVNSKTATFDKAQPKDVVFNADIPDGKTLVATINGSVCGSFKQGNNVLTISSDYFANLNSGEYIVKVTGAENDVELQVNVLNTTAPSMKDSAVVTLNKSEVKEKLFKWNLQETALEDVYVVGLDENDYTFDRSGITVNVDALAYGVNEFTVYTAVNSFDFQINVSGSMKWTQKTYSFNLTDNKTLNLYVDMAEKTFSEVKVYKNNDEIELYNTQLRYNNGVVTLSNDYVYALEQGSYKLVLIATDGTTVDGATLNVQGNLPTFSAVSLTNGTKDAPFVIYTKEQFISIVSTVNNLLAKYVSNNAFDGVYFELGADVDLDGATIDPIGTEKNHFKGVFNGNGYSLSNVKINGVNDGYTGLFAYNDGTIQNVRINNISVEVAKHGSVGIGLVAGYNAGTIKNVSVVGGSINAVSKSWQDILNAYFDIGGVVGYNEGMISRVDVEVEITAEVKGLKVVGITIGGRKSYINVGAVVGYFKSGKVQRCTVTASVDATSHNDSVTSNGWYGNTELSEEELAESMRRCNIYTK